MNPKNNRYFSAAVIAFVTLYFLACPCSEARAQQPGAMGVDGKKVLSVSDKAKQAEPLATDEKKEAVSLKLTAEEIKTGGSLWAALEGHQRDFTLAIAEVRAAAKKPNDTASHSLAIFKLNSVLENSDASQQKWNEWLGKAQKDHNCEGCLINIQTGEFKRPEDTGNKNTP